MNKPRDEYLCEVGLSGQSRLSIFNAANQDHINVLLTRLDLHTGMRVLDVACGTREITCQMATKYPGVQITGIDCSDEQIKIAKEMPRIKI